MAGGRIGRLEAHGKQLEHRIGPVAPEVFRRVGQEVIELFTEPDGTYPNHQPDPTVEANMQDLIRKMRETGADYGVAYDGDADRVGAVDERGRIVWGEVWCDKWGFVGENW